MRKKFIQIISVPRITVRGILAQKNPQNRGLIRSAKQSAGSLNLTGAQAARADIHSARSAVYDSLNFHNVGFESSVTASVGVRNLNAESNALTANFTFSHI